MCNGMQLTLRLAAVTLFAAAIFSGSSFAQAPATFKVRLSPVPMDAPMRATVAGVGNATGTLQGMKLTIMGSFEGLKSPATIAQIHRSVAAGVRGPAILDLTVTKSTSGMVGGSVDLNAEQVESLRKGQLYIQIHSEKAPDGNLWGWLLP
jgi:hypothetical protein